MATNKPTKSQRVSVGKRKLSATAAVARNRMEHAQLLATKTAKFWLDDDV